MEGELEKLLKMEDRLHERLIGQDEAVTAVSRRHPASPGRAEGSRSGPSAHSSSWDPTGVGKTELARALAEFLFDDENAMVRIDMSEYMEKFATSRLVGAPPGYVGYEEGGQLTEAVRRRPYQVVLFDEIEKAHPDVFNVLLQLLDDGRLTDSQGRTVDFKNTVIIMTSNVGSATLIEAAERGTDAFDKAADEVRAQLRDIFRPEFLNRVDEIIVFKPLGEEQLREIVGLLLDNVRRRLAESRITLEVTDAARTFIAREGYDPIYGARPLRRAIQRLIENPLAKRILAGDFPPGSTVRVDVAGDELTFEAVAAAGGEPPQDGAGPPRRSERGGDGGRPRRLDRRRGLGELADAPVDQQGDHDKRNDHAHHHEDPRAAGWLLVGLAGAVERITHRPAPGSRGMPSTGPLTSSSFHAPAGQVPDDEHRDDDPQQDEDPGLEGRSAKGLACAVEGIAHGITIRQLRQLSMRSALRLGRRSALRLSGGGGGVPAGVGRGRAPSLRRGGGTKRWRRISSFMAAMIGGNLKNVAHSATAMPGITISRINSSGTWITASSGTRPHVTTIAQKIHSCSARMAG